MDYSRLLGLLCISAGLVVAQDNPRFDPETPQGFYLKAGPLDTPFELKCMTDADAGFLVAKQLRFVHKSGKTQEERVISEQGSLMSPFDEMADTYALEFQYQPNVYAILTIKEVTDDMDGEFLCTIQNMGEDNVLESATTNVTVAAGADTLEMTIGEHIITEMGDEVEFEPSTIEVRCTVEGTNPAPLLNLTLAGRHLNPTESVAILDPDSSSERRSYKGSVTYQLEFDPTRFMKELKCHASPQLPKDVDLELEDKSVSATIKGILPDVPKVKCQNATASQWSRRVRIICDVPNVPVMQDYYFLIDNRKFTVGRDAYIEKGQSKDKYIFIFDAVDEKTFKMSMSFVMQSADGIITKTPFALIRDDSIGAASTMATSLAMLCSFVLLQKFLI